MPTDECIVDNYKKSKGEYPNSILFEREIEEAKKWVANENLKFAEKYPDQIPQPEQTGHYHIVRNLLFAVKKLTARAEQAERERDVLKLEFATIEEDGLCSVCKFESSIPLLQCMEDCCFKHRGLSVLSVDGVNGDGTERHGLPQEGEGV